MVQVQLSSHFLVYDSPKHLRLHAEDLQSYFSAVYLLQDLGNFNQRLCDLNSVSDIVVLSPFMYRLHPKHRKWLEQLLRWFKHCNQQPQIQNFP